MKKATAIFLLLIFLFNVGGYFLALWALEFRASAELSSRINQALYSEDETIEIRIPITLPYPLQDRDFERVDGKFEYHGEFYQLIKHKMEGDALVIVCIKNDEQKKVVETISEYVKITNDLPGAAKKAFSLFGKLLKDYESASSDLISHPAQIAKDKLLPESEMIFRNWFGETISPPPKA